MEILRSVDIEDEIRTALRAWFDVYCPPLPAEYPLPSLLVQQVGGSESARIDTFDVTLDARGETEASAKSCLLNAVGALKAVAKAQTTAIRHVEVNTSGSWGRDPSRPDLAMCSARLRVTAHQFKSTI